MQRGVIAAGMAPSLTIDTRVVVVPPAGTGSNTTPSPAPALAAAADGCHVRARDTASTVVAAHRSLTTRPIATSTPTISADRSTRLWTCPRTEPPAVAAPCDSVGGTPAASSALAFVNRISRWNSSSSGDVGRSSIVTSQMFEPGYLCQPDGVGRDRMSRKHARGYRRLDHHHRNSASNPMRTSAAVVRVASYAVCASSLRVGTRAGCSLMNSR